MIYPAAYGGKKHQTATERTGKSGNSQRAPLDLIRLPTI